MTHEARQRLEDFMNALDYRQRLARKILLILALFGLGCLIMVGVTSCASRKFPVQGSRFPVEEVESEFPKLSEP